MRLLLTACCLILLLFSTIASAKIVFRSSQDDIRGIYIMDDDGSNITLLTDTLRPFFPRWSPDGKQIVFQRRVRLIDSQQQHLFLMNADGTNIRELTPPINGMDGHPSFSPDGKSIVFRRYERIDDENKESSICVLNLESGQIKKITDFAVNDPSFSPDGKQIVFTTIAVAGGEGGNVWIMNADGSDARALLPPAPQGNLAVSRWTPKWSPDGKKILYVEDWDKLEVIGNGIHTLPQGYYYFIYDIRKKQSRQLNIPKTLRPQGIDWMDGDKSIVFSAYKRKLNELRDPNTRYNPNIYKYHIFTGKLTRLTEHPGYDYQLDWIDDRAYAVSPAGKMQMQWGTIKKFLQSRGGTFKSLSQNVLFFLRNQQ